MLKLDMHLTDNAEALFFSLTPTPMPFTSMTYPFRPRGVTILGVDMVQTSQRDIFELGICILKNERKGAASSSSMYPSPEKNSPY